MKIRLWTSQRNQFRLNQFFVPLQISKKRLVMLAWQPISYGIFLFAVVMASTNHILGLISISKILSYFLVFVLVLKYFDCYAFIKLTALVFVDA